MPDHISAGPSVAGGNSPIAQLLESLGMTREDLSRHSAQMREFLTAENANALQALGHPQDSPSSGRRSQRFIPIAPAPKKAASRARSHSVAYSEQTPTSSATSHPQQAQQGSNIHSAVDFSTSRRENRDKPHMPRIKNHRSSRVPPASSPARPKPSLDEIMQRRSRESKRVHESEESEESDEESDVFQSRPVHPFVSPHYRSDVDWKNGTSPRAAVSRESFISSTPQRRDFSSVSASGSHYKARDYTRETPSTPQGSSRRTSRASETMSSTQPSTPTRSRSSSTHYRKDYETNKILLPPSSPPRPSSPNSSPFKATSSPATRAYNLVSSPGPMDSDPPDHEDPDLPFRLPPGPYSEEKPELSYAALIGRAILASKTRGLRLKDIYDYISIVYPHFKRPVGNSHSQKWMNAIRQNLTNTPHFHKCERSKDNKKGRDEPREYRGSYWYIRDEDLPCFADGGYHRHAVTNMPPGSSLAIKPETKRKRKVQEDNARQQSKKPKLLTTFPQHPTGPNPYHFPYGTAAQLPPGYTLHPGQPYYYVAPHSEMLFPPLPASHPQAHLIPVSMYDPAHVVFPPLPPTRYVTAEELQAQLTKSSSEDPDTSATPPPSSASECSLGVPELTPNNSSSSPPADGDVVLDGESDGDVNNNGAAIVSDSQPAGPARDPLEPRLEITEDNPTSQGKGEADLRNPDPHQTFVLYPLPPLPSTPTAWDKDTSKKITMPPLKSIIGSIGDSRSTTPPPRPSTPPRKRVNSASEGSPFTRTPRARRQQPSPSGIHLSPTRNLAHYKTSLHPPPTLSFGSPRRDVNDANGVEMEDVLRTPSRRRTSASNGIFPSTPQKQLLGGPTTLWTMSPFRTPSRRMVFDPHDPSTLLDDELSRLGSLDGPSSGSGLQDSPIGFFGHGKGLLYESPSLPSPGQWRRPW